MVDSSPLANNGQSSNSTLASRVKKACNGLALHDMEKVRSLTAVLESGAQELQNEPARCVVDSSDATHC